MKEKHFTKPLISTCSALLFSASAYMADTEFAMAELPNSTDTSLMKSTSSSGAQQGDLPVPAIEDIVGAQGNVENGVLDIEIARKDIETVQGPKEISGVIFTPAFEDHGDLYFQSLSDGEVLLNGDMALKEEEVNPFISGLLKSGLVFQAFHQHLPMSLQIWFVHFRGIGDPLDLAKAIKTALNVTSTPFPQAPPKNPTSPLDAGRLASILHGVASVGDEGVITVTVERTDSVVVDGAHVSPEAGISTTIEFKPLNNSGSQANSGLQADVVPDFSMSAEEVDPVIKLMLNKLGWYQGCLYNQETAEVPQLYFDHMLKRGDPYQLAKEIRKGLDLTQAK